MHKGNLFRERSTFIIIIIGLLLQENTPWFKKNMYIIRILHKALYMYMIYDSLNSFAHVFFKAKVLLISINKQK